MKKLLYVWAVTLFACGSPERDLISTVQIVTDQPPSLFSHWHGDEGILARFGSGSEIGAIMQYSVQYNRSFIIFDETGKRFINDSLGKLTGPYLVKDLFTYKHINFWGLNDTSITNTFAQRINLFGVEAAVYSNKSGGDSSYSMTIVTKDGTQHVLLATEFNVPKIKSDNFGLLSKTNYKGALEAVLYDQRISSFYPILASDEFGLNFVDGDNKNLGKTRDLWNKIPSSKIEAMCYYRELGPTGNDIHTTILILGEDKHVSNGQFIYFIMNNGIETTTKLVDLRKTYP